MRLYSGPLSMFGMAKELLSAKGERLSVTTSFPLACASSFLAVWFLGHPDSYFGIGAQAGIHLGLFSQLIAWHLLLFYVRIVLRIGALENSSQKRFASLRLSVLVALLILTHALTFLLAAVFGGLYLLSTRSMKELLLSHGLGIGLSAFWLLPATILGAEYALQDQMTERQSAVALGAELGGVRDGLPAKRVGFGNV